MNLMTYDRIRFNLFGLCKPLYFIDSLYDLKSLPSFNKKIKNCREDLFAIAKLASGAAETFVSFIKATYDESIKHKKSSKQN